MGHFEAHDPKKVGDFRGEKIAILHAEIVRAAIEVHVGPSATIEAVATAKRHVIRAVLASD